MTVFNCSDKQLNLRYWLINHEKWLTMLHLINTEDYIFFYSIALSFFSYCSLIKKKITVKISRRDRKSIIFSQYFLIVVDYNSYQSLFSFFLLLKKKILRSTICHVSWRNSASFNSSRSSSSPSFSLLLSALTPTLVLRFSDWSPAFLSPVLFMAFFFFF